MRRYPCLCSSVDERVASQYPIRKRRDQADGEVTGTCQVKACLGIRQCIGRVDYGGPSGLW